MPSSPPQTQTPPEPSPEGRTRPVRASRPSRYAEPGPEWPAPVLIVWALIGGLWLGLFAVEWSFVAQAQAVEAEVEAVTGGKIAFAYPHPDTGRTLRGDVAESAWVEAAPGGSVALRRVVLDEGRSWTDIAYRLDHPMVLYPKTLVLTLLTLMLTVITVVWRRRVLRAHRAALRDAGAV